MCRPSPRSDSAGRLGAGGRRRKKGADPDSEEERWLDALEEGKLEQVRAGPEKLHVYSFCMNSGTSCHANYDCFMRVSL